VINKLELNWSQRVARPNYEKIPVVPVSYREKIRIGRSEINFFFEYFFSWFWRVFAGRFASRVPTSILTRDAYFLWTNLGNLVQ
jgi:hypothetical protein